MKLWEAWTLAKAYGKRPSEIYFIQEEVAAYCFDRAVHHFGSGLEAALNEAGAKAKNERAAQRARQQVLNKWLGVKPKFRNPPKVVSSG